MVEIKRMNIVEQIKSSFNLNHELRLIDSLLHAISFPWKFLFSFIPPVSFGGGWPSLFVSLLLTAILTLAFVQLSTFFGCLLHIKPAVLSVR